MVDSSAKRRFELVGSQIRACYGHSVPGRISTTPTPPPAMLFHGTAPGSAALILLDGLRPMGRQFVHLSVDPEAARQVGSRRGRRPTILTVATAEASRAGVSFYRGSEAVWLADEVPAEFLARH